MFPRRETSQAPPSECLQNRSSGSVAARACSSFPRGRDLWTGDFFASAKLRSLWRNEREYQWCPSRSLERAESLRKGGFSTISLDAYASKFSSRSGSKEIPKWLPRELGRSFRTQSTGASRIRNARGNHFHRRSDGARPGVRTTA